MKVVDEAMVPVCSPNLLNGPDEFSRAELTGQRLLFNEYSGRDWRRWAEILKVDDLAWDRSVRFDNDNAAIQAAVSGYGVALANLLYVGRLLETGMLKVAIECKPVIIGAHFLHFHRAQDADIPRVLEFRRWLKEAALRTYRRLEAEWA
jgi:LysR family glycine cleavage system transcriptional activator